MNESDDRYEKDNASRLVQGYWLPRPCEDTSNDFEPAFVRAKEECVSALRDLLKSVEKLTYDEFRTSPGRRL